MPAKSLAWVELQRRCRRMGRWPSCRRIPGVAVGDSLIDAAARLSILTLSTYGESGVSSETTAGRGEPDLPLLKGTLDLLILKTLTWGPMHGFGIASWLEARSGSTLGVEDSALYQSLHRLEGKGLVDAEWGVTENNRKARYYRLTRAGRQHLRREASIWFRYTEAVGAILTAETA